MARPTWWACAERSLMYVWAWAAVSRFFERV
jgi:hypothetical protein